MAARPKYLNLFQIRLPLPGLVSFLHRMSGAALFLLLPVLLALWQCSLSSAEGFDRVRVLLNSAPAKLATLGLVWAYLHHFFAGIRFLLMDVHVGVDLPWARLSASVVLWGSLLLTIIIGVRLW